MGEYWKQGGDGAEARYSTVAELSKKLAAVESGDGDAGSEEDVVVFGDDGALAAGRGGSDAVGVPADTRASMADEHCNNLDCMRAGTAPVAVGVDDVPVAVRADGVLAEDDECSSSSSADLSDDCPEIVDMASVLAPFHGKGGGFDSDDAARLLAAEVAEGVVPSRPTQKKDSFRLLFTCDMLQKQSADDVKWRTVSCEDEDDYLSLRRHRMVES